MTKHNTERLKECTRELRLLYVEDDKKVRDKLCELFRMLFKEAYSCENGKEGLDAYIEKEPDIVIADISMPVMDGLAMSKAIKERNPDAIIIVTTAYSDTAYLLDAINIGVFSYIIKPVDTQKLIQTLISAATLFKARRCITENLRLADELKEKNRILDAINKNLENLVQQETKKRMDQERLLLQQSKMAAMGEMLNAITHQWKQPISVLYSVIGYCEEAIEGGRHSEIDLESMCSTVKMQVGYMNQTVNDFKEFLKPTRYKKRFLLSKCIEETIFLFAPQAKRYNIAVGYQPIDEIEMVGYPNELKQAILNLLSNAKDAILSLREKRGDQNLVGRIDIKSYTEGDRYRIKICDNGGGIDGEITEKIFDPYFTTKGENGLGIGLVLVKNIIEGHFDGSITAYNEGGGACFEMVLGIGE